MEQQKKIQPCGVVTILSIATLTLLIDHVNSDGKWKWGWDCNYINVLFVILTSVLAISVYCNRKYIFGKKHQISFQEKLILLIRNTFSGSILDISLMIYFLLSLSWIPESLLSFARDGQHYYRPFIFIGGFLLAIKLKPFCYEAKRRIDRECRTVLVTGISDVKYKLYDGKPQTNLTTILKPVQEYPNINKIIVLLSDGLMMGVKDICNGVSADHELYEYFHTYKKSIEKYSNLPVDNNNDGEIKNALKILLQNCMTTICSINKTIDIVFTDPVDYNVFEKCEIEMLYRIGLLQKKDNIEDKQIIVNISPGTSIVSGVMTLNAIKGQRGMVYTKQTPSAELVEYKSDVLALSDYIRALYDELIERQSLNS